MSAGLDLEPSRFSFVYTYPASRVALTRGAPLKDGDRLLDDWPDLSLYLHIPFCSMECSFCSLHRVIPVSEGAVESYLRVLESEIRLWGRRAKGTPVTAVYIGGGTPTFLSARRLRSLLDLIGTTFRLASDVELTVECAPDAERREDDWTAYLSGMTVVKGAVTRISTGVQSWHGDTLRQMGRRGGKEAALAFLKAAAALGRPCNIDFVLGYSRHEGGVGREVDGILACVGDLEGRGVFASSVSVYQLWDATTVRAARSRHSILASGEEMLAAKLRLQEEMYLAGYEPSPGATFLRRGSQPHRWTIHRCKAFRHLGIGSGAYSFYPNAFAQRRRNLEGYSSFEGSSAEFDLDTMVCRLSIAEQEIRRTILGMKTMEYVHAPASIAWDSEGIPAMLKRMQTFADLGLVERKGASFRLSRRAFMLSNEIAASLRHAAEVGG